MSKTFNQSEYVKNFNKDNYKQFKTELPISEKNDIDVLLTVNQTSKVCLIRKGVNIMKDEMGFNTKTFKIEKAHEHIVSSRIGEEITFDDAFELIKEDVYMQEYDEKYSKKLIAEQLSDLKNGIPVTVGDFKIVEVEKID